MAAGDINLPNLVSHLQVNLADTSGLVASATQQGSSVGAALGQSMRQEIADAVNEPECDAIDDAVGDSVGNSESGGCPEMESESDWTHKRAVLCIHCSSLLT
mgnify:CR=1 FL=1